MVRKARDTIVFQSTFQLAVEVNDVYFINIGTRDKVANINSTYLAYTGGPIIIKPSLDLM